MVLDQQLLHLILGLLLVLVLALAICVAFLVHKVLHQNKDHEKELPKKQEERTAQSDPTLMMCVNHPERQAQGLCAISEVPICESCLREDDGLVFSVDHFRTYLQAKWTVIEKVKATPEDTTASAHIYKLKRRLWAHDETPTLVSTHYRIDVDTDQIESHIHFLVREQEKEDIKAKLSKEQKAKA